MAIQRDSKLGYGYLFLGFAVPPLIQRFLGEMAGLVAYAVFAILGVVLLLAAHHDHIAARRSFRMTVFVFTLYGAVLGALGGGLWGGISHIRNKGTSQNPIIETTDVQLAITCDQANLPTAYREPIWLLDTVWFKGLMRLSPGAKSAEGLWPQEHVAGWGYKCSVRNYGTQAAFGVSLPIDISVLSIIRHGTGWETGPPKANNTITLLVPQPLSPQGGDSFSFYVCSYDPESALSVKFPTAGWINSDDPHGKREIPIRFSSSFGRNPIEIPPKIMQPEPRSPTAPPISAAQNPPKPSEPPGSVVQNNSGSGINVQQGTTGPNSPIINSPITVGAVPKTISAEDMVSLSAMFQSAPVRATVVIWADKPNANTPFPEKFLECLRAGNWTVSGIQEVDWQSVEGQGFQGAILLAKGEPVTPGERVEVRNTDPLFYVMKALQAENVPFSIDRNSNFPEGTIKITFVGGFPP